MTVFGQQAQDKLWDFDLTHLGELCERLRVSRGLTGTDIASFCNINPATITKFEGSGNTGSTTFKKYLNALKSAYVNGKPVDGPLQPSEADILRELHKNRSKKKLKNLLTRLTAIEFETIANKHRQLPKGLDTLLDLLKQKDVPAFIIDPLWFIHAMNGAAFLLFDLTPKSKYLYNWEAWHTIGAKFRYDSPIRNAHINTNRYFPPTIHYFFQDELTYPFLFTFQMRYLIFKLHQLSYRHNFKFTEWWLRAARFDLPFDSEDLIRTIVYKNQEIQTIAYPEKDMSVTFLTGHKTKYRLASWEPKDQPAERAFKEIKRNPKCKEIYFAADYDKNNNFHVNDWPEVKEMMENWLN